MINELLFNDKFVEVLIDLLECEKNLVLIRKFYASMHFMHGT